MKATFPAYVVNVERRQDRRKRMERILPNNLVSTFTTEWDLNYDAHRLDECPPPQFDLFPWEIESENKWFDRPLKKGEVCCSIAHWAVWNQIAHENQDIALILEDDIWFAPDFVNKLSSVISELQELDSEWDLLYLGRVALEDDEEQITERLVRPMYSHCTYGYILSYNGVQKLLNADFDQDIIPVDEFLPAMYTEHVREDVRSRYQPCLSAYAVTPDLIGQLPKEVAGSETENSEFVI